MINNPLTRDGGHMIVEALSIPGCLQLYPKIQRDLRGKFVKTVHQDTFAQLGLVSRFQEQYYTYSRKGVLRGLHFQRPPEDHVKLVTCIHGEVLDVVVDLRLDSSSYGKHETIRLEGERGTMLYLPAGVAHGFYSFRDSILLYHVTSQYSPGHDAGIHWDSAEIAWPDSQPIISERDSGFPPLNQFSSPFRIVTDDTWNHCAPGELSESEAKS